MEANQKLRFKLAIILLLLAVTVIAQQEKSNVFFEDFESGIGSWWADNGLWEVVKSLSGSISPSRSAFLNHIDRPKFWDA